MWVRLSAWWSNLSPLWAKHWGLEHQKTQNSNSWNSFKPKANHLFVKAQSEIHEFQVHPFFIALIVFYRVVLLLTNITVMWVHFFARDRMARHICEPSKSHERSRGRDEQTKPWEVSLESQIFQRHLGMKLAHLWRENFFFGKKPATLWW